MDFSHGRCLWLGVFVILQLGVGFSKWVHWGAWGGNIHDCIHSIRRNKQRLSMGTFPRRYSGGFFHGSYTLLHFNNRWGWDAVTRLQHQMRRRKRCKERTHQIVLPTHSTHLDYFSPPPFSYGAHSNIKSLLTVIFTPSSTGSPLCSNILC